MMKRPGKRRPVLMMAGQRGNLKMMYDWLFTPDDADIAASNGYDLGVRGGEAFKTESRAIWHGKRWMKECGRTGTITAIPAIYPEPYHIIEW